MTKRWDDEQGRWVDEATDVKPADIRNNPEPPYGDTPVETLPYLGNELADVPKEERRAFEDYLAQSAQRSQQPEPMPDGRPMPPLQEDVPDFPQQPPPELPEVAATNRLFSVSRIGISAALDTILDMADKQQLNRFEDEIEGLYNAARVLLWQIHKVNNSPYVPPEFPVQRTRRVESQH